jgi:hypothetical protein
MPPVQQFVDSATIAPFVPKGATVLTHHGALIVTRTDTRSQTTMSIGGVLSNLSNANWKDGLSGYSFLDTIMYATSPKVINAVNVNKAHTFANPNGLAIIGYGIGNNESYYYLAASALKDLSATFFVNEEEYFDVYGKEYCNVSSLHLKSVAENKDPDEPLTWFIDDNEQKDVEDLSEWDWDVTFMDAGEYTIRMQVTDLNGEIHNYATKIKLCARRRFVIPVNPY